MSLFDVLRRLLGGPGTSPGRTGLDATARNDVPPEPGPEDVSCEEALRLVQEFLDGELGEVPSARLKRHFEICQGCYPHLRLEEAFRTALHKAAAGERASPELRERVLEVLEDAAADR